MHLTYRNIATFHVVLKPLLMISILVLLYVMNFLFIIVHYLQSVGQKPC